MGVDGRSVAAIHRLDVSIAPLLGSAGDFKQYDLAPGISALRHPDILGPEPGDCRVAKRGVAI
jgi:hypothetical protein